MRAIRLTAALFAAAAATSAGASTSPIVSRPLLTYAVWPTVGGGAFVTRGLCATDLDGHTFRVSNPRDDRSPAWSPDGRSLAFSRTYNHRFNLFTADAQGRRVRNLTRRLGGGGHHYAAWSPDGSQLAFVITGRIGASLVVMNADGTDVHALVDGGYAVGPPSWSPDGRRILFSSAEASTNWVPATYVIDEDGTNRSKLVDAAIGAVWAPDGARLAYFTYIDAVQRSLVVAEADGSDPHVLTQGELFGRPAWSPDGRTIAFTRGPVTSMRVVLISPDGTGERVVSTGGLPVVDPAWRRSAPLPAERRPCVLRGTSGADVLRGTERGDLIVGGRGRDMIDAAGGDDVVVGEGGRDRIHGGRGKDVLGAKDRERDLVFGGPGKDIGYFDAHLDRVTSIEFPH